MTDETYGVGLEPFAVSPKPNDARMEGIGSYAVRLVWNDGHSSGLFTWETLRRLADEAPR